MHHLFHSLIFAQILGLYLVIMSIIMLLRRQTYSQFVDHLKPTSGIIILAASFALIIGLFMITIHNIWVWHPDVVITIIGWLIVIKSILWLWMPEEMITYTRALYRSGWYYVVFAIVGIIGIFLMITGFYPFTHGY